MCRIHHKRAASGTSQAFTSTGAQALEAQRIYIAMKDGLCRPDALTLTSLATAYQRAGNWDRAEQVELIGLPPVTQH